MRACGHWMLIAGVVGAAGCTERFVNIGVFEDTGPADAATAPACTPGMDQTCNDEPTVSSLWGSCGSDGTCTCREGLEVNPATGRCRPRAMPDAGNTSSSGAPSSAGSSSSRPDSTSQTSSSSSGGLDGGVCQPGTGPGCNDDPEVSSLQGVCLDDGTCACNPGHFVNPETGRCRRYRDSCALRGGTCAISAARPPLCPFDMYHPFSGDLSECGAGTSTYCCVAQGSLGSPCSAEEPCNEGGCLQEASGYPPGGVCARPCTPEAPHDCPDYAICIPVLFSAASGSCMVACNSDGMCRDGWSCQAFPVRPWVTNGETVYVCWAPGMWELGALGAECQSDENCLSARCRAQPGTNTMRCTSACDDDEPCLPGFTCQAPDTCSTAGCRSCFP